MTVRIGINGFGRIGRDFLRSVFDRKDTDIEVVAVNDITSAETLAHLLRYDSTYGTWQRQVTAGENEISVNDKTIKVLKARDPREIPWDELSEPVTAEQVNQAFKEASQSYFKGILRYTTARVVSRDIIGDPASCVFDSSLTMADQHTVKAFGWYDNEWGYASRTVDLIDLIARTR